MKKALLLICALLVVRSHFAQSPETLDWKSVSTQSTWKSFTRHDFVFQERAARLVAPHTPLPGNPWIWRARFPDWHTEADSILLSEGFHLAYINTDNLYGSPQAVAIWDQFYDFLTKKVQLKPKVALMGVSRGGLFVYNWAKKNPEKVSCIYAEAPVCDFTSWPGGFGESEGSAEDWKRLKAVYGFGLDAEAQAYADNPRDNLAGLAQAKVPILHMVGLEDRIVPVEENTFPLVNAYLRLGGSATVVPCTEGEQRLQGHHFPIETPRRVADFVKYHSLDNQFLNSSTYHESRKGLKNSHLVFERKKKASVAFLGGSITHNPGWRDSVCKYLTQRFPQTEFEFIAAGIPSMGTTPAAFRLERDVLSKGKVDLLFEEAAVNDATNGRTAAEQIRGMEGIVRRLRTSNPEMDIVIMHFVDPDKIADYDRGEIPEVILNHEQVAHHYHISTLNLAREVRDRIRNQEFTWENDFKNLHPSPFGQGVYAHSMIQFLEQAYAGHLDADDKIVAYPLPEKLDALSYDQGAFIDITEADIPKNWQIAETWNPQDGTGTRPNYVDVPMLISEAPGKPLKLSFRGKAVGIAVAAGQDAGMIEYRIDKGEWQSLDLFTRWSKHLHLPWYHTLANGLSQQKHVLEIRVSETKATESEGKACRIRYFYVNRF